MSETKNILVFADWFLPGYRAGGPIRSLANLVQSVDAQFFIVTRNKDHHNTEPYQNIVPNTWSDFSSNVKVWYAEESTLKDAFWRQRIQERSYDVYYFNSLFSPRFTIEPMRVVRSLGKKSHVILAPRGTLKAGALSVKPWKKKIFLAIAKVAGWYDEITWHATNEAEREEIHQVFGKKSHVIVAPNISRNAGNGEVIKTKDSKNVRLISVARVSPEKGILEGVRFIKEAKLDGVVNWDIYGALQNEDYLQKCQSEAREVGGVVIGWKGEIAPEVLSDVWKDYHFLYQTTWGENYGHAIAEGLMNGVPLIISDRTPWKKVAERGAGWDLPLSAEAFVPVLSRVKSMDQDEYDQLVESALKWGKEIEMQPEVIAANRHLFGL